MLVIMALSSTWQWHVHGWFCWFDAERAVFTSLVGRPAAKSCMAALFGSCMVLLVLLVTLLTAVCFP